MKTTSFCVLNFTAILDAIRSRESEILLELHASSRSAARNGHTYGGLTGTRPQFPGDRAIFVAQSATQIDDAQSGLFVSDAGQAAAKFLEAGLTFLESLCPPHSALGIGPIELGLSTL